MMEGRVRKLRYGLGDAMGDYAPDYLRRTSSSTNEVLVGVGSVMAAIGIGYMAMRLADRKLSDLIDSFTPGGIRSRGRERPMVHGTSGGEMPDADQAHRRDVRERAERPAVQSTDGTEWPKPETESTP